MVERALRRHPVTAALLAMMIVVAVLGLGRHGPRRWWQDALATGYEQVVLDHRWWTVLGSMFLSKGWGEFLLVAAIAVVLLGVSERLMGSARTLLAFVVSAVFGTLLGIALQGLGYQFGELWARRVSELTVLDPMTAVVGTIMAASAFAGPLWRRRIRVVVLVAVLVFLLYSGTPSDLYRAAGALAGFVLGLLLKPSETGLRWVRSSHHEARMLLATVVSLTAIGPLITIISPVRLGPLAPLGLLLTDARPSGLAAADECRASDITRACLHDMTLQRLSSAGPVLLTLLPLLMLLVAAVGIVRGRRFAAVLAIAVNLALAALAAYFYGFLPLATRPAVHRHHLLHAPRYWEVTLALGASVLVPLAVAVLLAAGIRHLTVRLDRRAVLRYLLGSGVVLLSLSALYVGVGALLGGRFHPAVDVVDLLSDLPERFVPVGFLRLERLDFLPSGVLTSILYFWIGPLFWAFVAVGAFLLILGRESAADVQGLARLRGLLTSSGGSLGYWATWTGNSYWFSPDERAAVAYRVIGNVALTSSEPIGPRQAALAAIGQFARFCDDNGWTPVFYSIHAPYAAECRRMGWSVTGVGDETVIRPDQWQTTGKRWQDVRSSINRAERAGVRAVWAGYGELSAAQSLQIHEMSEQWVADRGLPEMGFTLGGLDELRDPEVRLMLAVDSHDRVVGATSWLPTMRHGTVVGWTLDFMRRTPDGMNGVMEFLLARCAERFRLEGIEFMSLSAAPLAGSSDDDDVVTRLLHYLGSRLEPLYGFRSLFAFKRKFQPALLPLSMAYPDPIALPAIGLALARAYLPSLSLGQSIRLLRRLN